MLPSVKCLPLIIMMYCKCNYLKNLSKWCCNMFIQNNIDLVQYILISTSNFAYVYVLQLLFKEWERHILEN